MASMMIDWTKLSMPAVSGAKTSLRIDAPKSGRLMRSPCAVMIVWRISARMYAL